jgi:hypothetical protein
VPSQEGHAREDEDVPEWEVQNKVLIKIRLVFAPMKDVTSIHKWYGHDQFKPENQVKEVPAQASKEAVSSELHQAVKRYQDVEAINGQKIAWKNMKEASISYQTGSSDNFPYT